MNIPPSNAARPTCCFKTAWTLQGTGGCSEAPWHQDISINDQLPTAQNKSDLIIIVMGLTGAGKSTFINRFLGEEVMEVNHGLKSCTQEIECVTITLPQDHARWPNRRLVLVDTPGFNDTQRGEFEILRKISVWLASAYENDAKITGLVYLHSIGNARVGGAALLSYDLFRLLCGPDALDRVVMATTHWTAVQEVAGKLREQELTAEFWAETLMGGACYRRVQTPLHEGEIIEHILTKHYEATVTRVQQELIDLDKRVKQTDAGQILVDNLRSRLSQSRESVPQKWLSFFSMLIRSALSWLTSWF